MKSNLQALGLLLVSADNADEFLRRAKVAFKDYYQESMLVPVPQNDEGKKAFLLGYVSERKLKGDFLDCVDAFSLSTSELLLGIVDINLSEDDVVKWHWYPGPPKLTDQERLITTNLPGAPAAPEKTSIAVYVVGRDFGGEHKVFALDVPFAAADHEVNDHLIAAEARVIEDGYEVLCSFDENEHAAKAVNRAACIPMLFESNSAVDAPTPS